MRGILAGLWLAGAAWGGEPAGIPLWTFGVWGGRETVSLADDADLLEGNRAADREDWLAAYGGRTVGGGTPVTRGWAGGWVMDRRVAGPVAIGLRIGFAVPSEIISTFSAWGAADETATSVERVSASLTTVLAGGSGTWNLPAGFRLRAGAWAGPVFAAVTRRHSFVFYDPNLDEGEAWSTLATATGSGIGLEAELEAGWSWHGGVEAFVGVGWRRAAVRTLHWAREADLDGDGIPDVARGDVAGDDDGSRPGLRASGALARVGIRVALSQSPP